MSLPATSTLIWIVAVLAVAIALGFVLPAFLLRNAPTVPTTCASSRRPAARLALVAVVLLPVLAFGLNSIYGDPGAFRGRAGMTARERSDPHDVPTLREQLVAQLERNPRDGRAWVLFARLEFDADRYAEAAAAFAKAIAASPKVARDPAVWCEYADALGMAQGGSLAGAPRELVMRALSLDPAHPKALEMAGSAAVEARDYATAVKYWRELLALLPERAQMRGELEAAISRADELASRH